MNEGDAIPELRLTPDRYVPYRYAGASGDFNPIHLDAELATAVGLPGTILHGLYTMAQVALAASAVTGGDPRRLKRLSVKFRRPAFPEREIAVTGSVKRVADGRTLLTVSAEQGGKKFIRNAEAEVELG